jgi:hypothetical protein
MRHRLSPDPDMKRISSNCKTPDDSFFNIPTNDNHTTSNTNNTSDNANDTDTANITTNTTTKLILLISLLLQLPPPLSLLYIARLLPVSGIEPKMRQQIAPDPPQLSHCFQPRNH